MRKLILILFILLSCASLANSGGIISFPGGGVPSSVCVKDAGTLVMAQAVNSDTVILSTTFQVAQTISHTDGGGTWKLHSIDLYMSVAGDQLCDLEVRIGDNINLTGGNIWETWTVTDVQEEDDYHTFLSVDNDTYTDGTTYWIGIHETGGNCRPGGDSTGDYAGGNYHSDTNNNWTFDGFDYTERDVTMNVYKCQ